MCARATVYLVINERFLHPIPHSPDDHGREEPVWGLRLEKDGGTIVPPKGMTVAKFEGDTVDEHPYDEHFYINKGNLNGRLYEVGGRQVIRAIGSRYMTLVKAENGAHVPFYISSEGTDGKTRGAWHPFFGVSGMGWLVKGFMNEKNRVNYSPQLNELEQMLNSNLKLPLEGLDAWGRVTKDRTVLFDLNEHLKFEDYRAIGTSGSNRPTYEEIEYVRDFTGYCPPNLHYLDTEEIKRWVEAIVSKIG